MKPIFGVDITQEKHNEQDNAARFRTASVSAAHTQVLEEATQDAETMVDRADLPKPLRILYCFTLLLGMGGLLGIIKGLGGDVFLSQGYQNAPWAFWGTGGMLAVALVLWLLGRKKAADTAERSDFTHAMERFEGALQGAFDELQVPAEACEVDVLAFQYKTKKGQPVPAVSWRNPNEYVNLDKRAFCRDGNLCLADAEGCYALPLAALTGITTVKKRIGVPFWNKETPFNKGEYKRYKLWKDNAGRICMRTYHILVATVEGEEWGLYFPCYELPVFEKMTGLHADSLAQ